MEPLTPEEIRVVGALVEKQLTTPDNYPLTQNALIAACNQLSNRNPVVSYDDPTVRQALASLRARQLARVVHIPGSRVPKHRHVLDEALGLDAGELALVGVLALRGAQTPGELRTRTERMHTFASLSEVEAVLDGLAGRADPLVGRLERQPGQKEARYAHLLGGDADIAVTFADPMVPASSETRAGDFAGAAAPAAGEPAGDRIAALEARVADLEAQLAEVRQELGLDDR